jgi:hypothetical protein
MQCPPTRRPNFRRFALFAELLRRAAFRRTRTVSTVGALSIVEAVAA